MFPTWKPGRGVLAVGVAFQSHRDTRSLVGHRFGNLPFPVAHPNECPRNAVEFARTDQHSAQAIQFELGTGQGRRVGKRFRLFQPDFVGMFFLQQVCKRKTNSGRAVFPPSFERLQVSRNLARLYDSGTHNPQPELTPPGYYAWIYSENAQRRVLLRKFSASSERKNLASLCLERSAFTTSSSTVSSVTRSTNNKGVCFNG